MNFLITLLFAIPVVLMLFGFIMAAAHYIKEQKATVKVANYGILAGVSYAFMSSVVYMTVGFPIPGLVIAFLVLMFFVYLKGKVRQSEG